MKRTVSLGTAALMLAVVGCGMKATVPPKLDLGEFETIGIIDFECSNEGELAPYATEQFIECGMEPIGDAWIRYSAVYYLYALIFVALAVDVLFLIPVALVYDRIPGFGIRDFVEVLIFVAILSLVIVYAWKKGLFEWNRKTKPQ